MASNALEESVNIAGFVNIVNREPCRVLVLEGEQAPRRQIEAIPDRGAKLLPCARAFDPFKQLTPAKSD